MLLAFVVVIDGWRQRSHDARERVLQRRHNHLQRAYAAVMRSVVVAMELQHSRRLIARIVNSLPPALSSPVGRDESLVSTEFIGSLAESMSWLRTIHPNIASADFRPASKGGGSPHSGVLGSGQVPGAIPGCGHAGTGRAKAQLLELDVTR